MDRSIEQTFVPQPYRPTNTFQLTQYPVGNLINPGIAGTFNNFDFSLPMYGREETKKVQKDMKTIPGSVPEKEDDFATNTQDVDIQKVPVANQGGFGNIKNDQANIFKAMQTPKIKINKIKFQPQIEVASKIKKKKLPAHKFKLI